VTFALTNSAWASAPSIDSCSEPSHCSIAIAGKGLETGSGGRGEVTADITCDHLLGSVGLSCASCTMAPTTVHVDIPQCAD
jgi:hypothetical protein